MSPSEQFLKSCHPRRRRRRLRDTDHVNTVNVNDRSDATSSNNANDTWNVNLVTLSPRRTWSRVRTNFSLIISIVSFVMLGALSRSVGVQAQPPPPPPAGVSLFQISNTN